MRPRVLRDLGFVLTMAERHIEFDLGGLPHPTISVDYLERLSQHLHFESMLKYAALPRVTMETTAVTRKKKRR